VKGIKKLRLGFIFMEDDERRNGRFFHFGRQDIVLS
jgi:hypothetical protein